MNENRIPLGELLDFVSQEIRKADERAKTSNHEPAMKFMECEIDCAIDVELKADGGVHVWVLNLGTDAKRTEKNSIKVKYTSLPEHPVVALVQSVDDTPTKPLQRTGRKVKHDEPPSQTNTEGS